MKRPRKLLLLCSIGAAALSVARLAVLILENLAIVADERLQDQELISLCKQGAARGSSKMRAACLQAQADSASPIILKTISRSLSVCYADFLNAISTPWGVATVLLFCVSSLFLPVAPILRAIFEISKTRKNRIKLLRNDDEDEDEDIGAHVVLLPGSVRHRNLQNTELIEEI